MPISCIWHSAKVDIDTLHGTLNYSKAKLFVAKLPCKGKMTEQ